MEDAVLQKMLWPLQSFLHPACCPLSSSYTVDTLVGVGHPLLNSFYSFPVHLMGGMGMSEFLTRKLCCRHHIISFIVILKFRKKVSFQSVSAVPLWAVSCLLRLEMKLCIYIPGAVARLGSALTAVHPMLRSLLKKIFIWFWQNKQTNKQKTSKSKKTPNQGACKSVIHSPY